MADWTPQSRAEEILFKTINGEPYDGLPQSRIEELLLELKDVIESGGGGGGGTDNYNLLKNLPQINGQTVKGNMSGTTLGLVNMVMGKDLSTNDYTNADKAIVDSVTAALADKVDKVTGKGLSENDYTDADKAIVGGVTSALADKVDKVTGKGLSTNDYDDTAKGIVNGVTSALAGKVDTSSVGSANGVAELDANGKVPSSQLPSYVDDTIEGYLNSVDGKFYADSSYTTEIAGETGKIYVTLDTNKTYRWSGSGFVEISESLALGETSSTAYAGNKGKANADAIAAIKDGANIDSFGDVETALAGKADVSALANYASLDIYISNSEEFPDANTVTKELVYINGFQSGLTNYPSEVSNTVGILLTRWFYYSGDLTVQRMQLVFTLVGKSFCRVFDGTSWTSWSSTSVGILSNLTTTDKSSVVDAINEVNSNYEGVDLTVKFASEISNYSNEWAWIQSRLNNHNVRDLHIGDYIPINIAANGGIAAETHKAEIAGINTYYNTGDSGHEVGYHIDWITRDCYSQTVQFNTTNNNNGNANSPSPFLASNLKSWLDGTLYPLLDAKLKNVIKTKRILAPSRYQSGATLTDDNSWAWQDFDKLWVPLETEIFDCLVWSTKGFGNGQAVQYPIFANSYEHRMKGVGPGGARASWWTASASSGNSETVVYVSSNGHSNYYYYASGAFCVPVCFRTMED